MKSALAFILLSMALFQGSHTTMAIPETCLNAEERKLYTLITEYRKVKKLKEIPYSSRLTRVAQAHVRDLESYFDYENKNGCNPHSWSDKGNWTPCCYSSDHTQAACMWKKPAEIAGYASDGFEIAYYSSDSTVATEALEGWKSSEDHNPLLINLDSWRTVKWNAIGIGIYKHYAVVWFGESEDPSEIKACL